jgi:hypothetical protein
MNKAEIKKEFKERWNKLFPNKRLLAVQLNGFTHSIFYDEQKPRAKVKPELVRHLTYSGCVSREEAISYGMNDDNVVEFFKGFPNYQYQNNAIEIVYVMPDKPLD